MTQRSDARDSDRFANDLLDGVIRGSVAGRFATAAGAEIATAWTSSATRRLISPAAAGWHMLPTASRVRTIALAGGTAMVVHLVLSRFGAVTEPLAAVVPVLVIVACSVVAVSAGAVARTWERFYR